MIKKMIKKDNDDDENDHIDDNDYNNNHLGLIGEQGGETERRGPGRDTAGEGGT